MVAMEWVPTKKVGGNGLSPYEMGTHRVSANEVSVNGVCAN